MKNQFTFNDILGIIIKRWWIILLCGVIVGCAAFAYTELLVSPLYTSKGTLYVNNKNQNNTNQLTTGDVQLSQQLVNTYSQVLKSKTFCQNISQKLSNGLSAADIQGMITMEGVNETEILQISAESKNPEIARAVVQEILNNAPEEITRVVKAGSVEVVDNATLPTEPSSPNVRINTLVGVLIGIVLSIFVIFILEFFDTTIKDEDELFEKFKQKFSARNVGCGADKYTAVDFGV